MSTSEQESSLFAEKPVLMVAGLFVLAAIPIGFFAILMYGSVSGSEFSPDDFTRRQFSYQQIPWLNLTISGIEYTDVTTEIEQTLITDGLIKRRSPKAGEQKTWHLFHDSAVPDSHQCDARFLTSYLDFSDWDSNTATSIPYWLTWNEKFPLSARIFWPNIADLARNEMYLVMPDLMRFALNTKSDEPKEFQAKLNHLLYSSWVSLAKTDLQMGNYENAIKRLLRAKMINDSDEVNDLIELSSQQIDNISELELETRAIAQALAKEISEALSARANSKKSIGARASDPSESVNLAEEPTL